MSAQGDQAAMLKAVRITQGRLIDLLVAHNVEPNAAYCDRAVEELQQPGFLADVGRARPQRPAA